MARINTISKHTCSAALSVVMSRKTLLVQHGKVWSARGTPSKNPHMLTEIVARYPGVTVLNAIPIKEAVKLYNASVPAC